MRIFLGLTLSLFLAFTLAFLAAESFGWLDAETISRWIAAAAASNTGHYTAAALVMLLLTADLVLPIPSSIVMTLSGAFLGCLAGTAASFIGAMGSALLAFGLCRRYGQRAFEHMIAPPDAARIERFFQRHGAWGILLSRSVPMLTEVVSCMAGLSRLPWPHFVLLSAAGTLPVCLVYAWAGSHGAHTGTGWALLIAFALPALALAILRTGLFKNSNASSHK